MIRKISVQTNEEVKRERKATPLRKSKSAENLLYQSDQIRNLRRQISETRNQLQNLNDEQN